ncbi:esterase-like activity of phytase family protein [Pseudooceanicola atlanticus]|uniref:esterase-like activity of phytase family protein n=1 Tax=Pseudooceanicola atlanticus TaxID=1461694 RepID=UPI0005C23118|nr:esterase-like activity of phytase family protein [Pseudooceanicola atlanticus]
MTLKSALIAALLALGPTGASAQEPVRLSLNGHDVGGLSGVEITEDGLHFVAVSDRGLLVRGDLIREGGRLTGARVTSSGDLVGPEGPIRPASVDSEGIAIAPDGRMILSFEGDENVWIVPPEGSPTRLPAPPDPNELHENSRYEAVAVTDDGRILTLPERSGHKARPFPIWLHNGTRWTRLRNLPRRDDFLPVGADFAPDGTFYLLERKFDFAFFARIRRFDIFDPEDEGEVVYTSPTGSTLNYEGLSAWTDAAGNTRLTLVSDNNFFSFVPTSLLEISLARLGESR